MKFIVENAVRNAAQISGTDPYDPHITDNFVGDTIEACSAEEAIDFAIEYLIEHSDLMCERTPRRALILRPRRHLPLPPHIHHLPFSTVSVFFSPSCLHFEKNLLNPLDIVATLWYN